MVKLSRRSLLLGASLLALSRANAGINNPGSASSQQPVTPGFNGGVTQTNSLSVQNGGQFIMANFIKSSQGIAYSAPPTDPTAPGNPIIELDSNGYPTTIVAGTGGYNTICQIPNGTQYSGTWVMKWDGTGTVQVSAPGLFQSSSSGRFTFTNPDSSSIAGTRLQWFVVASSNTPNHVRNLRLCRLADETGVDNGSIVFFADHMTLMKSAKPGSIRSLGWGGGFDGTNTASIGLWAQRRPTGFITYQGDSYFNSNWWGGTTTNSGTDYSLAFGGFTLTDKVAVQLRFNIAAVNVNITSLAWSTTSGSPVVANWTGHNLVAGNTVMFGDTPADPFTPPAGVLSAVLYYVIATGLTANSFQFSATSGGAAVNASATTSGTMRAIAVPRININNTGFVPMTNFAYPTPENIGFSADGPKVGAATNNVSTLVYDATSGWYRLTAPGGGMINGGPPEVFIDYCAAVGSHPWLTAPYLSLTIGAGAGVTDYMPSWLTYVKNTYSWMKPLVEPYNETWNNGTAAGHGSFYAYYLPMVLWGTPGVFFADKINQTYGKWVSDLGNAMKTLFANDRTKYSMICACAAVSFNGSGGTGTSNDNRLKAAAYVTAGGTPGYPVTDRVCIANYYSPTERFSVNEVADAFNYSVINAGNPSGQDAIANSYAATADVGTNSSYNLTWNVTNFTNMKSWAQGMPGGSTIAGMVSYEGGWSPDYLNGNWTTSVGAGITQANPCVLTINAASTNNSELVGFNLAGNPASGANGIAISLSGVGGMTQLNNATISSTFTSGNANIAATNTLVVNQAITYPSTFGTVPSNMKLDTTYFVIAATGTTYQVSLTRGGTAVVPASNASCISQPGWFVTSSTGTILTLDVDSSGFSAFTSGGTITWMNSRAYSNILRQKGGDSAENGTLNTKWYGLYFAMASVGFVVEFPSNFIYFGSGAVWFVIQPTIYAPLTPQWSSIVAAN